MSATLAALWSGTGVASAGDFPDAPPTNELGAGPSEVADASTQELRARPSEFADASTDEPPAPAADDMDARDASANSVLQGASTTEAAIPDSDRNIVQSDGPIAGPASRRDAEGYESYRIAPRESEQEMTGCAYARFRPSGAMAAWCIAGLCLRRRRRA